MPIYEYQCASCGQRLERLRRLSDPPLTECPACGESALERLVSAPAFQFKGSGWYVTDYARQGKKDAAASSDGGSEGGGDGKKGNGGDKADKGAKTESKSSGEAAKPSSTSADAGDG